MVAIDLDLDDGRRRICGLCRNSAVFAEFLERTAPEPFFDIAFRWTLRVRRRQWPVVHARSKTHRSSLGRAGDSDSFHFLLVFCLFIYRGAGLDHQHEWT